MAPFRQSQRPLLLIHGYSADASAFSQIRSALEARGVAATLIDVCTYISLNNEVTIKDIAEGLDRAFRTHPALADENQEFDAIVHSTGMLVLRSWLANGSMPANVNARLRRLKHLVGLAPATWGSPQAHKGRTWIGALIKGNKQPGPDFLNAGDRVLDGLELGSEFTWKLAHVDLLGELPYYAHGAGTPYVGVFIGSEGYDGLASLANDPGTDGTVRWAGCGLNTRKIVIDLTRTPRDRNGNLVMRTSISSWADERLDVPMIPVADRNHATILSRPDATMIDLMVDFLQVGEADGESYNGWLNRAQQAGRSGYREMVKGQRGGGDLEGWQQLVVHVRDERGDGVRDYMLEILCQEENGEWTPFGEMYCDVHTYGADASFRCFHVKLPQGVCSGAIPLRARIHASTGTELMAYQGYGSETRLLTATSEPVEVDLSELAGGGTLFHPFTTTLIEIILNREPLPFDGQSRLFQFVSVNTHEKPSGARP